MRVFFFFLPIMSLDLIKNFIKNCFSFNYKMIKTHESFFCMEHILKGKKTVLKT
jgi:hypothetical protein